MCLCVFYRDALRAGKRLLKEGNGSAAMVRFEKALMLSMALRQKVQERRATRGLAAAARLQGQYKTAIGHLERVLEISKQMQEFTGETRQQGSRTVAQMCVAAEVTRLSQQCFRNPVAIDNSGSMVVLPRLL